MLNDLKRLAEEKSSERRVELLRKVTDLYLAQPDDPSASEAFLFSEIMERVMADVAPEARAEIAEQVAPSPRTPVELARRLAGDENIAIASPVLSQSPVLGERDIAEIASRAADGHLQAIACRTRLSTVVTDILINRGSNTVLRTVSGNHGADISQAGMKQLTGRAQDDGVLASLLVDRPDITQEAVSDLGAALSAELALRLAERGFETGDALPAELAARARAKFDAEMRRRQSEIRGADQLLKAVQEGSLSLDQAIQTVVEAERLLDVAALLAPFLNLDRNFVFQTVATGDIQTVVVAFRSLELSHETLTRTLALRARKRNENVRLTAVSPEDYEALEVAAAQRTIRFLKVRLTTRA